MFTTSLVLRSSDPKWKKWEFMINILEREIISRLDVRNTNTIWLLDLKDVPSPSTWKNHLIFKHVID